MPKDRSKTFSDRQAEMNRAKKAEKDQSAAKKVVEKSAEKTSSKKS